MRFCCWESPVGWLTLAEEEGALVRTDFGKTAPEGQAEETPLLRQALTELSEYFSGKRREFTVPLRPAGTPFQKKVWEELRRIPFGETRSYGEIAAALGNPRAGRAVGMANNKNPLPIWIPCHRVVRAGGKLVGYAGGLDVKEALLRLEGVRL